MRRALWAIAVGAALGAVGCPDGTGPVAGELAVNLSLPGSGPRALVFRLVGAQTAVTAPSGSNYRVFVASAGTDTARVAVVAPRGSSLATGALVRVAVPDVGRASAYLATASEAAGADYALQSVASLVLSVTRP